MVLDIPDTTKVEPTIIRHIHTSIVVVWGDTSRVCVSLLFPSFGPGALAVTEAGLLDAGEFDKGESCIVYHILIVGVKSFTYKRCALIVFNLLRTP